MSTSINERFEIIIQVLFRGNKRAFAKAVGISPTVVENVVGSRKGKPSFDVLEKVCSNANISSEWLLLGKGEMFMDMFNIRKDLVLSSKLDDDENETKEAITSFHTTKEPVNSIPLVSEKAVGGFANEHFSINKEDVLAYYMIPKFRHLHVDFMIEIIGDSMIPKFYPGDIIACSIIHNSQFIQWNKPHLIATREQGLIVKRIRKSSKDGCLLAVSDNHEYDTFDIPKDEITGMARIVGVIHLE